MNSLLRNVLEEYINTLNEREFDTPFLTLLLQQGFYDIHYLHGNYEFGKDFIAKRAENNEAIQYLFQSKAGDIDLPDWRKIRMQIDDMRTSILAHPNFGRTLPRIFILVTTGRLVGGAALSAQEYDRYCIGLGERGFNVWDKDTLIEMLINADPVLTGLRTESNELLALIMSLRQNKSNMRDIEVYSRYWVEYCGNELTQASFFGVILESAMIIHELIKNDRNILACFVSVMPIRAMMHSLFILGHVPEWSRYCLELSKDIFRYYSDRIINIIEDKFQDDNALLEKHTNGFDLFISYPVLCVQIIELLGLRGLLDLNDNNFENAKRIAKILKNTIEGNPGCYHPISNKYAVSYITPILLLTKCGYQDLCQDILRNVVKWICDRYQISDVGLANPYATEEEEIKRLLGYPYDFLALSLNRESYLATVLLDLISILEMPKLYEDALNDILAVGIYPSFVEARDTLGQFLIQGDSVFCPRIIYKENWNPEDGWRVSEHHFGSLLFSYRMGYWWESLCISSILRDRHQPSELKGILNSVSCRDES
jgi:hypothetical protein